MLKTLYTDPELNFRFVIVLANCQNTDTVAALSAKDPAILPVEPLRHFRIFR